MKEITKEMLICDIMEANEEAENIFLSHSMNCLGCPGGSMETLEDAADAHSVSLEILLKELNK